MRRPLLDLKNFLDRFLVENITTYPVHCIRGITDNSTASEPVSYLPDAARLGIIWINGNQHSHSSSHMNSLQNEASFCNRHYIAVSEGAVYYQYSTGALPVRIVFLQCRQT
jgi:hypothetical protein